jgi:predicted acyltransferase (DUF342 family)
MAQIIKHRRGSIGDVKTTTTRNGEVLVASGSISDLAGPFVFIGSPVSSDEGVAGAFKPTSKIYSGTSAPTIGAGTYGSILDGTPFYASSNESLYILNNDGVGNDRLDLTGNIEGNTINATTITTLTSTTVNTTTVTATGNISAVDVSASGDGTVGGDLTVTGDISGANLALSGNATIDGNIVLGGNINIGDADTDTVSFGGEITSNIVPDVHNTYDLGSSSKNWRNLHVSGTAYISTLATDDIQLNSLSLPGNLTVSGTTTLNGDTIIGDEGGDTLTINAGTIDIPNISAGTDNTVLVYNGSSIVHDEIDARVWGSTLVDGAGTATQISFWSDADSITGDSDLTYNSTTNVLSVGSSTVGNDISAAGTLTVTSTSELKGAVGINSTLNVTGSAQLKSTLDVDGEATLASAVVEDLTSGRVVLAGTGGAIEDNGNLTFNGSTLGVTGDVNASGDLGGATATITGNADIGGDVGISGNTTMTGTLTVNDNVSISGNLEVLGSATNVTLQSQTVEIDDNILRLNAYSPFERYAGFEVIDSGSSSTSASLLWDSQNDYWSFIDAGANSSKVIGTVAATQGSETSLTNNAIPVAAGANQIEDSLLTENGTTLAYNTNKFTVASSDGATLIAGNVTVSSSGGSDAGSNSSSIVFRNSSNVLGYVSTSETTDVLDGILGYKNSDGSLAFSTVIDGGSF